MSTGLSSNAINFTNNLNNQEEAVDKLFSSINPVLRVAPQQREEENSRHLGVVEDSGWYYDQQLSNPFTSIRLMSNKELLWDDNNKKWAFKDTTDYGYITKVASSILTEDLQIDVVNSWGDGGIDELVGAGINNLIKPVTPYVGIISSAFKEMNASQKSSGVQAIVESEENAPLSKILAKAIEALGTEDGKGQKALNALARLGSGNFMSQGCSFVYYQGSSTNFGNLGMRFTLFPNYDTSGEYLGVLEQVALLLPFCMGLIGEVNWDDVGAMADGANAVYKTIKENSGDGIVNQGLQVAESVINSTTKVAKDLGVDKRLQRFIKWQNAPGGYTIDKPESIDSLYPGTLCLEIGPNYKIEGLVITNMNLNFSKQMVKNPNYFLSGSSKSSNLEKAIEPLYCEVTLQLRPITKYSDRSLIKFVQGNISSRSTIAEGALKTLKDASEKYKTDTFNK